MRGKRICILIIVLLVISGFGIFYTFNNGLFTISSPGENLSGDAQGQEAIKLPEPNFKGTISVEEALYRRRSVRDYSDKPLSLGEVSQLLWAAQGITDPSSGWRTAPSAGATFPMEIYLVIRNVENLESGVYKYQVTNHSLILHKRGDFSKKLQEACLDQTMVGNSAMNIILAAVFERTTRRYGKRGEQYVYMEAGHIGQNIYLQAEVLNLGTVMSGAFTDNAVKEVLNLQRDHIPLSVMPVGKK